MIKYLINLIVLLFILSCNELNLNNVSDVVENSTNNIEEIIDSKKKDKIFAGKNFLKKHENLLKEIGEYFKIQPRFIVAVLGMESY